MSRSEHRLPKRAGLVALVMLMTGLVADAQDLISSGDISSAGTTYTENFDGIGSSDGFAIPSHWEAYTDLLGANLTTLDNEGASTIAANGSSSNFVTNLPYANYDSYTGKSASNRSIGFKVTSSPNDTAYFAIKLTNTTGATVNDLNVVYTIKGWRIAGDGEADGDVTDALPDAANANLAFEYLVDGDGSGTITGENFVSVDILTGDEMTTKWWDGGSVSTILDDYPDSDNTREELLDGEETVNQFVDETFSLSGLNWGDGEVLWLRWRMGRVNRTLPVVAVDDLRVTIPVEEVGSVFSFTSTEDVYTEDFDVMGTSDYDISSSQPAWVAQYNDASDDTNTAGADGDATAQTSFAVRTATQLSNVSNGAEYYGRVYNVPPSDYLTTDRYTAVGSETDRAVAFKALQAGRGTETYYAIKFTNNTGATVEALDVSYLLEAWRISGNGSGGAAPTGDLRLSYKVNPTAINDGDFLLVDTFDGTAMATNFPDPWVEGDAVYKELDGNAAANQVNQDITMTSLGWGDGDELWIRWYYHRSGGQMPVLAIDDLSVSINTDDNGNGGDDLGDPAFEFTATTDVYSDDFDDLGTGAVDLKQGWEALNADYDNNDILTELTGLASESVGGLQNVGSDKRGGLYNVPPSDYLTFEYPVTGFADAADELDRAVALKAIQYGNDVYFAIRLLNSTDETIDALDISYILEGWRESGNGSGGSTASSPSIFTFGYAIDPSGVDGAFTLVGEGELDHEDLNAQWVLNTGNTRLDGNEASNQLPVDLTLANLAWESGEELWIRWNYFRGNGQLPVLAIEDLEVSVPSGIVYANTDVSADLVVCNQVDLSWTDVVVENYSIQRSVSGADSFTEIATVDGSSTVFSDTSVDEATAYDYMVIPVVGGEEVATSNVLTVTTLTCPADLTVTADGLDCDIVSLSWGAVEEEGGFNVYRSTDGTNFDLLAELTANTEGYNDTGLTASTSYSYYVETLQEGFAVKTSATVGATTAAECTGATTAVTDLDGSVDCDQITLFWTDVLNEDGYRIQRKLPEDASFTTVADIVADDTTYTDTGLTAETTYQYQVISMQAGTEVATSNQYEGTTIFYCNIKELVVEVATCDIVYLSWDDVDYEDEYRIRRREVDVDGNPLEDYVNLTDVVANVLEYIDVPHSSDRGKYFQYMVRPLIANTALALSNTPIVQTQETCGDPEMVTDLAAEYFFDGTNCSVLLTWTDVLNDEGYSLQRKISTDTDFTELTQLSYNVESFEDFTISGNTDYVYKLVPLQGGAAFTSAASSDVSVSVGNCDVTDLITDLSATASDCEEVTLTWTAADFNQDTYRVERKLSSETDFITVATLSDITTSSYTDNTVNELTSYDYQLVMTIGGTDFSNSNTASVTTSECEDPAVLGSVEDSAFGVYPNPVSGVLSISGLENGSILEIYHISGALAKKVKLVSGQVSVGDLDSGVYVITSDDGEGIRFIKE